jgi:hypothetical protein
MWVNPAIRNPEVRWTASSSSHFSPEPHVADEGTNALTGGLAASSARQERRARDRDELAEVRWVRLTEAEELMRPNGMFGPVRDYLAKLQR